MRHGSGYFPDERSPSTEAAETLKLAAWMTALLAITTFVALWNL